MHEHSEVWREHMTAFLCHCRASAASEQADRLREAIGILHTKRSGDDSVAIADDLKVGHWLAQSAFECAALEVLGPKAEFELSCGKGRDLSARVRLPGQSQFSSSEGRSIALALLAAWASAQVADTPRMLVTSDASASDAM